MKKYVHTAIKTFFFLTTIVTVFACRQDMKQYIKQNAQVRVVKNSVWFTYSKNGTDITCKNEALVSDVPLTFKFIVDNPMNFEVRAKIQSFTSGVFTREPSITGINGNTVTGTCTLRADAELKPVVLTVAVGDTNNTFDLLPEKMAFICNSPPDAPKMVTHDDTADAFTVTLEPPAGKNTDLTKIVYSITVGGTKTDGEIPITAENQAQPFSIPVNGLYQSGERTLTVQVVDSIEQNSDKNTLTASKTWNICYVSSSGNDSQPGTVAEPFKTLQKAVTGYCTDSSKEYLIIVLDEISGSSACAIIKKRNITIDGKGSGILNSNGGNTILDLKTTAKVILKDITLTGANGTNGGGVYMTGAGTTLTLESGAVINANNATYGGGVYVEGSAALTINAGATITGNTATHRGGGVYVKNGHLTMAGGNIHANKVTTAQAYTGGSGVYVDGSTAASTFTMTGGTIAQNTTSVGGGVYLLDNAQFILESGNIKANKATKFGGAVYMTGGSSSPAFTMTGGTINENTAEKEGAGVYVGGSSSAVGTYTLKGGTVSSNTAGTDGGGVYNEGDFVMIGGTISSNTAKNGGGVCENDGFGSIKMQGGTITDCTATEHGGGLYCSRETTLSGGSISGCTAKNGGGIYLTPRDDLVLSGNFSVKTCQATENGKGLYVFPEDGDLKIEGGVTFDAASDVYLPTNMNKNITITGALTRSSVATITPASYSAGKVVLKAGSGVTLGTQVDKFAVTKDGTQAWGIDAMGKLQKE